MSDVVRVKRAEANDWEAVRSTRLTALADAPLAFGSTLKRENAFNDQEWQRRVRNGNWFLAWLGPQPVGIVAGIQETGRVLTKGIVYDEPKPGRPFVNKLPRLAGVTTIPS